MRTIKNNLPKEFVRELANEINNVKVENRIKFADDYDSTLLYRARKHGTISLKTLFAIVKKYSIPVTEDILKVLESKLYYVKEVKI